MTEIADQRATSELAGGEDSAPPPHLEQFAVTENAANMAEVDEPPAMHPPDAQPTSIVADGFRTPPQPIPAVSASPVTALSSNVDEPPVPPEGKSARKDKDILLLEQEVENHKANRELRDTYADKAHRLAQGCICFWVLAVSSDGIIFGITGRQMLSDTVLIALTTGVTINVLAAFLGVIKGLFPSANSAHRPAKSNRKGKRKG